MKAISPMIAVVLLIAFTVAVGGLLSVWFTTITTSQTSTVQASGESLGKCAQNSLDIESVKYPSSLSPRIVNVTVASVGTQSVKNLTITVVSSGGTATSIKFFNATGDDMSAGTVFATTINASNITLPPELVKVNAFCQGRSIAAECAAGQDCMNPT